MVSTTRSMSWRTLLSRSAVPSMPRKYLEATTFVASCDQAVGTSTSFCSNTVAPPSAAMLAGRRSQGTSS
jgi:hypothetical protein